MKDIMIKSFLTGERVSTTLALALQSINVKSITLDPFKT